MGPVLCYCLSERERGREEKAARRLSKVRTHGLAENGKTLVNTVELQLKNMLEVFDKYRKCHIRGCCATNKHPAGLF